MVAGGEERDTADAFEAGAAEEDIGRYRGLLDQIGPEETDSSPRVEDHFMIAAGDQEASGIAAVADGFTARTGDSAPHAPKLDHKTVFFH